MDWNVIMIVVLAVALCNSQEAAWNYHKGKIGGPDKWHENYPDCSGVMQSPINIDTKSVLYDSKLQPFDFTDYKTSEDVNMILENHGGHTAEVIISGSQIILRGGNLPDDYILQQFHFHWGNNDGVGSEHTLDSKQYPMEIHFVHYQSHLVNATQTAPVHPFGLAVVGFFFKIGRKNDNYEKLLSLFQNITNPNEHVKVTPFPIIDLLPESKHFFRYQGSLTTPPCYETVLWSVGNDPIEISSEQMSKFRKLLDHENKTLVDDFRPLQALNHRTILTTDPLFRLGNGAISPQLNSIFVVILLILYFVIGN